MPADPALVDRLRDLLVDRPLTEKAMFGGIAFMLGEVMAVGIIEDRLVVRTSPERGAELLAKAPPGLRPMDFTGKPMKGWLYAEGPAIESDAGLRRWVEESLVFAATATPRKRRR